ncbi:MAG: outer membrane beta-barrel protein, partial [Tannerella sp.]|nr:outer membrane beta-barrel protein [Tannerella sp.]
GKFAIPNLNPGDYRLALSFMGYKTLYIEVAGLTKNLALPDILMEEESVGLDAVTVTGSAVTSRIDRKLVFPTERQINASSNGIDLLHQLMLPRLQVNPLTRDVSIPGGGEVQLRINGVKAEVNDIVALQPKDIIRVEYHDNPGLRYGNAAAVIDYIIRRHETGGNLGINLTDAFNLQTFDRNSVNGKINHKKSEFSVNYGHLYNNSHQMWRDNEEIFRLADGSVLRRKEEGEPGHMQRFQQNLNLTYNYLNEKRMFNATVRYNSDNKPHEDYMGKLYNTANPNDYVQVFDGGKNSISNLALDLYYQENLKNGQTLVLNLVGTNNRADNSRIYTESRDGIYLTDINNLVIGDKYSWIGEGIYEKQIGDNRFSAGLRHTQSYADNTYQNGHNYNTRMQQGETFLYGEWKGRIRKLDYSIGTGVTRYTFTREDGAGNYNYYAVNPRLNLFLPLSDRSSVRLTASLNSHTPSLAELSDVVQDIDSLQIQRGNPDLTPSLRYYTELNYEWKKGLFYANLQGRYTYHPSAVMEERLREGDRIVKTWNNQKDWQYLNTVLYLRIGPVRDILTFNLQSGLNRYISNGNTYRHVYNNPYLYMDVSGMYKNFILNAGYGLLSWGNLYGETMTKESSYHQFMLSYKYRNANFGAGVTNPFANVHRQDSESRSEYASYKRSLYINDSARMFFFTFSWNMTFGRHYQSGGKRLNNADDDTGVMKAGK